MKQGDKLELIDKAKLLEWVRAEKRRNDMECLETDLKYYEYQYHLGASEQLEALINNIDDGVFDIKEPIGKGE